MSFGPIQLIVITFDDFEPKGEILPALDAAVASAAIRLIDLQFVRKDHSGKITSMEMSGLSPDEQLEFGAVVGALIGAGVAGEEGAAIGAFEGVVAAAEGHYGLTPSDVREISDSLPAGGAAALLMIEHSWATDFRDAVWDAGGSMLAQGFMTPETLFLVGAELEAQAEALASIAISAAIQEEAALEAVEAVIISEAIQDEAARQAVEALVAAKLIEDAAIEEAAEVVAAALLVEDAALKEIKDQSADD